MFLEVSKTGFLFAMRNYIYSEHNLEMQTLSENQRINQIQIATSTDKNQRQCLNRKNYTLLIHHRKTFRSNFLFITI